MKKLLMGICLLIGCGGGASGPAAPPPLELVPMAYLPNGTLKEIAEDGVLSLDPAFPPAQDFAFYITAVVKNLTTAPTAKAVLSARLLDAQGNVVGSAQAETNFAPVTALPPKATMAPAGAPFQPDPLNITTVLNMTVCPEGGMAHIQDELTKLEMTLTDSASQRTATVTRGIVPICYFPTAPLQLRCHRTCAR